jgi:predicted O-methyltransferase YrrM
MSLPCVNVLIIRGQSLVSRDYMHRGEQEALLTLLRSAQPKTVVEIGVNIGLTARAVLHNIASIESYVGIDVPQGYEFEIPAQEIERPARPGMLVEGDPRFTLRLRGQEMPTEADVVFIDGDHGRNAVLADSLWAVDLINGNGLIVWHDYGNPNVQVTEVLDMLQAGGRDIRSVTGTWLAFERLSR